MGRTTRWFRALIGSKNSSSAKDKKKWGFMRSSNGNDRSKRSNAAEIPGEYEDSVDANKHAIAVAAATAAVAEAALAAAQAAAEVVRLTRSGGGGSSRPGTPHVSHRRRDWAAVKIQSAFRAYLARRALRALKGLVRLQALVRGHIVRKQSADMLRRMQALARIQARVCSNRAQISESSQSFTKSSRTQNSGLATPKRLENKFRAYGAKSDWSPTQKNSQSHIRNGGSFDLDKNIKGMNWLNRWMEECSWNNQGDTSVMTVRADDERSDKILEVDTCYPHLNSKRSEKRRTPQHALSYGYGDHAVTLSESLSRHSTKSQKQNLSASSGESLSLSSVKYPTQIDETVWTNENSPQVYSAASSRPGTSGRKGPFSPARSEHSRNFCSGYIGYPNYMANTESYRAKVRSHSAPRQRSPFERLSSTTRFSHGYCDSDTVSESGSALRDNLRSKAYPGSGRSDRLVIPVQGNYNYAHIS